MLRLAGDAAAAGLHGVVCSGAEAAAVRAAHGDRLALLVPGIRLAGGSAHDQRAGDDAGGGAGGWGALSDSGSGGDRGGRSAARRCRPVLTELASAG